MVLDLAGLRHLNGPQRVVQVECQCMGGLDASAGGEAGRGSAAARADCEMKTSGAAGR